MSPQSSLPSFAFLKVFSVYLLLKMAANLPEICLSWDTVGSSACLAVALVCGGPRLVSEMVGPSCDWHVGPQHTGPYHSPHCWNPAMHGETYLKWDWEIKKLIFSREQPDTGKGMQHTRKACEEWSYSWNSSLFVQISIYSSLYNIRILCKMAKQHFEKVTREFLLSTEKFMWYLGAVKSRKEISCQWWTLFLLPIFIFSAFAIRIQTPRIANDSTLIIIPPSYPIYVYLL